MEREYLLITQASPKRLKNKRQEQEFVKKLGPGHVLLYVLVPLPDIKMGPPWDSPVKKGPCGSKNSSRGINPFPSDTTHPSRDPGITYTPQDTLCDQNTKSNTSVERCDRLVDLSHAWSPVVGSTRPLGGFGLSQLFRPILLAVGAYNYSSSSPE